MVGLDDSLNDALSPEPDVSGLPDDQAAGVLDEWREQWVPQRLDDVDWCARRLGRLEAQAREVRDTAAREIARINAWCDEETDKISRRAAWYRDRIEWWHTRLLDQDPDRKTVRLPSGATSRIRAARIKVIVEDPADTVAWCEEHAPELLRRRDPEVDKRTLARRCGGKATQDTTPGVYPAVDPDTGEIIPGVMLERSGPVHTVDPPPADTDSSGGEGDGAGGDDN